MTGALSAYRPTWGEFVREFGLLCCTAHRMMVVRKGCLQRDVSCRNNLRCKDDGLTDDPVTVLGDIVLDGLFPAKGLLRANVNSSIIRA